MTLLCAGSAQAKPFAGRADFRRRMPVLLVPCRNHSSTSHGNKLIIEAVPPRSLIALLATLEPLGEAFPRIPDETPDEVEI